MKLTAKLFALVVAVTFCTYTYAAEQVRRVSGFSSVSAMGAFDVYITQGNSESVKVDAPSDVIDKIITEVVNGELRLYVKDKGWNPGWFNNKGKDVKLYVSAKQLNAVSLTGSGDVSFAGGLTADDLKVRISGSGNLSGKVSAKRLECRISGSGDMKLEGSAPECSVSVSGSGDYSGRGVQSRDVQVRVTGSGDASVYASESLNAHVSGSGDVNYAGSPKNVSKSKSGSGDIEKL